jgi:CRP/FNR family cyclic AMP-dependent transcriptional regulator
MDAARLLRGVSVFDGLDEAELQRVATACRAATFERGQVLARQGEAGSEMFIVGDGLLEIRLGEEGQGDNPPHTIVNMGAGQVVGEMALIDYGPRSATVRCATDTCEVLVMDRDRFDLICRDNHRIGMVVYRNLAADLSFKLRHRHLTRR